MDNLTTTVTMIFSHTSSGICRLLIETIFIFRIVIIVGKDRDALGNDVVYLHKYSD